jgi:sortase (surface protein transpeptidase)
MGLVLFLYGLFAFMPENREQYVALPDPVDARYVIGPSSIPVRLSIPSIGVDAPVELVGKALSGAMAVPRSYSSVGWYKHGAIPGHVGNAVIAGHVDTGFGRPAVFKELGRLSVGDEINIIDAAHATSTFVVSAIERYPYDAAPRERIFGTSDQPRLNLITCDGAWDAERKIYSDRLVIYTTLKGI